MNSYQGTYGIKNMMNRRLMILEPDGVADFICDMASNARFDKRDNELAMKFDDVATYIRNLEERLEDKNGK